MLPIILISEPNDQCTTTVLRLINRNSHVAIRINNYDDFLNFYSKYRNSRLGAVWFRRPFLNSFDSGLDISCNNHLANKYQDLFTYFFASKNCYKLGSFNKIIFNRLLNLKLAREIGLNTPEFEIVTSDSELLNIYGHYQNLNKRLVTKSISNELRIIVEGAVYKSYTSEITLADLNNARKLLPSMIMEFIEKRYDIRSFYLDGNLYSMAIFSQGNLETQIDYRNDNYSTPMRCVPYKLSKDIEGKLIKLHKELNLNCSSIDLVKSKNNDYYFLEINPVGQFNMISQPCNYNLHLKIAQRLCNMTY